METQTLPLIFATKVVCEQPIDTFIPELEYTSTVTNNGDIVRVAIHGHNSHRTFTLDEAVQYFRGITFNCPSN